MNEQTNSSFKLIQRRIIKTLIVIGSITLLVFVIVRALTCVNPSRNVDRELAAWRIVILINEAQKAYFQSKGHGKYADLRTLAAGEWVDVELTKSGYIFTSEPVDGDDKPMFDTTARPSSTGTFGVGNRSYYSNETDVIYAVDGGAPPMATPQNRIPQNGRAIVQ